MQLALLIRQPQGQTVEDLIAAPVGPQHREVRFPPVHDAVLRLAAAPALPVPRLIDTVLGDHQRQAAIDDQLTGQGLLLVSHPAEPLLEGQRHGLHTQSGVHPGALGVVDLQPKVSAHAHARPPGQFKVAQITRKYGLSARRLQLSQLLFHVCRLPVPAHSGQNDRGFNAPLQHGGEPPLRLERLFQRQVNDGGIPLQQCLRQLMCVPEI